MIRQTAIVTNVRDGMANVKVQRESTCGQCSVQKGCGTSVFSKVLGNKFSELTVLNPIKAEAGDVVILGLHESALLKTALLMYMFPLVMMFAGGFAMVMLDNWLGIPLNQGWVVLASFVGLLIAFILISKSNNKFQKNEKYQPVILSKATLSDIKSSPFNVEIKPL